MKEADMKKSIYELTEMYPEIIDIMKNLGFKDIANPVIRKTAGRKMTIPAGCKIKGFNFELVKTEFKRSGFTVLE